MLLLSKSDSLTSADVAKLLQDPSGESRAVAASKVAATFGDHSLTDKERELAEGIFRHMVNDAEVRVRQA